MYPIEPISNSSTYGLTTQSLCASFTSMNLYKSNLTKLQKIFLFVPGTPVYNTISYTGSSSDSDEPLYKRGVVNQILPNGGVEVLLPSQAPSVFAYTEDWNIYRVEIDPLGNVFEDSLESFKSPSDSSVGKGAENKYQIEYACLRYQHTGADIVGTGPTVSLEAAQSDVSDWRAEGYDVNLVSRTLGPWVVIPWVAVPRDDL